MDLSFLTPPKVVLSALMKLYTEQQITDASDAWLQLALFLVEEVKSADQSYEKTLDEIFDDMHDLDCDATEVIHGLQTTLEEFQSPDDLFNFLSTLRDIVGNETEEQALEPNSVLGVFARKVNLSFQSLPFERFCALYDKTANYIQASQLGPLDSSSASIDDEQPISLSVGQLQAHVHREACILEESAQPCDLQALGQSIDEMMPYAPQVPQVHNALGLLQTAGDVAPDCENDCVPRQWSQVIYLRFLHCIRVRDFEKALDSLHRYFDLYKATHGSLHRYFETADPWPLFRPVTDPWLIRFRLLDFSRLRWNCGSSQVRHAGRLATVHPIRRAKRGGAAGLQRACSPSAHQPGFAPNRMRLVNEFVCRIAEKARAGGAGAAPELRPHRRGYAGHQ